MTAVVDRRRLDKSIYRPRGGMQSSNYFVIKKDRTVQSARSLLPTTSGFPLIRDASFSPDDVRHASIIDHKITPTASSNCCCQNQDFLFYSLCYISVSLQFILHKHTYGGKAQSLLFHFAGKEGSEPAAYTASGWAVGLAFCRGGE